MFSKPTEYAIRAVIFLAANNKEKKRFGIKEVAERLNFPEPYLAKILQNLAKNNIINSAKGPQGGFFATDETMEYSLLDIIDSYEGLSFFKRCGLGLTDCNDKKPCPIHDEYSVFRNGLYNLLSGKKIKDIVNDLDSEKAFVDFLTLLQKN
jgi:Rrf2 family protein